MIEYYVDRGWVFVAARLQRHLESGLNVPHPLSFTFRSEKPVYPLRLTGVGGDPLDLELYVFGPGRASVSGLTVKDCLPAQYGESMESWHHRVRPGMIRHATLNEWSFGLPVVTRLRGTLTSQQMSDDAEVRWRRFREVRDVQYSRQGAWTTGLNRGSYIGLGIWIALTVLVPGGWRVAWLARIGPMVALGLALLVTGVSWWMLPTMPVRFERVPGISMRNTLYHAYFEAMILAEDQPELALPELRRALAERLATASADARSSVAYTNLFTGQPVREEDSPGNYILRQRNDQIEFVAHDPEGAPVVLGSFRTATDPEP